MNDNVCMQEGEESRASLGRVSTRSGGSTGACAREDKAAPIAGPSVSLVRCDSASSMASAETTESTTASIAGKKRHIVGEDSSSSSSGIPEIGKPKKPKGKKQPQASETHEVEGGCHRIRDPMGRFAIAPRETRKSLKKLEGLGGAGSADLDKGVQLSTWRLSKSRVLKQKMLDEMSEHPTEEITSIVGEEVELVEKLTYSASNLSGTTQKAFYVAAAKIKAATSILEHRVQAVPGGDALEELRGEMEALKRENAELRTDLKFAKAEIKKLKERTTVSIRDSPGRKRRTASRINSDSDSDEVMQVEVAREGNTMNREGGAIFPRPQPPLDMETMTPVFRPPLRGVASRNLDNGSLGAPPQEQTTRDGTSAAPDIRAIITSVLKEMGLAGGRVTPQQMEGTPAAQNPNTKGKKGKKGKEGDKVGQTGRPPSSLLPPGRTMPPPITAATARPAEDQGRRATDQPGPSPSTQQTGIADSAQQPTWAMVTGRRGRRRIAQQLREQQGSETTPPAIKKGAQHKGPADRTGAGAKVVKLGNAPRTPAVTITAPPVSMVIY